MLLSRKKIFLSAGLFLWAFVECCVNEAYGLGREVWDDPSYSVFVFIGDLLLLMWMWGLSIHVWRRCNIPWVSLLGLDETQL